MPETTETPDWSEWGGGADGNLRAHPILGYGIMSLMGLALLRIRTAPEEEGGRPGAVNFGLTVDQCDEIALGLQQIAQTIRGESGTA